MFLAFAGTIGGWELGSEGLPILGLRHARSVGLPKRSMSNVVYGFQDNRVGI